MNQTQMERKIRDRELENGARQTGDQIVIPGDLYAKGGIFSSEIYPHSTKLWFDQQVGLPSMSLTMPSSGWLPAWTTNTSADGDEYIFYMPLLEGTHTFTHVGGKGPHSGKTDLLLDDVVISASTFDWYAATISYGFEVRRTGIVVARSGVHKISVKTNGNNANSDAYDHIGIWVTATRTGS